MRTVVFSDPALRRLLDTFFVCTWKDLEGDPQAGGSPRIKPDQAGPLLARGSGLANMQLLILTPDARLLTVIGGLIEADDLKWEISQALITYAAIQAKPDAAARIVAWRQARIQDAWLGLEPRKATGAFRIPAPRREAKTNWRKPSEGERRLVARQRAIVKRNPLAPEHRLKTGLLSGGKTSSGFANDGRDVGARYAGAARQPRRLRAARPYPYDDMPLPLRRAFAKAVGHALPAAAEPAAPAARPTPRTSKAGPKK